MSEVRLAEEAQGPALSNGRLSVKVHANKGTFDIVDLAAGRRVVAEGAASLTLSDGPTLTTRGTGFLVEGAVPAEDDHGRGLTLGLRREAEEHEPELVLSITLYEDHPFAVLEVEAVNRGAGPVRIGSFQVLDGGRLDLGSAPKEWRFYKEGWQNWSPALALPVAGEDIYMAPPIVGPATQPQSKPGRFVSELMTAVVAPQSRRSLVAGFISSAEQFSQVWLDRQGRTLTAASYADRVELKPGRRMSSERLAIEPASEPRAAMLRYGDALARQMGATPWPRAVTGWCSWYYYYQGLREEHIVSNLEYIAAQRRELPVEYLQIDDGYQAGIGDWLTTNEKFAHGMGWLAERIHERGLKAGLWLAPFMIGQKSRLWQEHPDWAVQYKTERPYIAMINWGQECYAMDLTRPDVIEWLEAIFRKVFDEWGYDYVKVDFLYAGAVDGIRNDPNVTRAQAYRRGIETIRSTAGERFILGCGMPVGPSVGIINGARIGPDVTPFWYPAGLPRQAGRSDLSSPSVINSARNVLNRFWMHGRLWLNDPDCLLARDSETVLNLEEIRTLVALIGMSGGMMLDSDDLTRLSPERRKLVSMLLPVYGKGAMPLDLFDSEMPGLLELDCERHRMLALFNWQDDPAELVAPLAGGETHVYEVWEGRYLGVRQESLSISIPAHGCRLLALRPVLDRPQFIASTFHLLQGALELADEEWDGRKLILRLRPVAVQEGEVLIWTPERYSQPKADGLDVRGAGNSVWSARLVVDEERDVTLRF